MHNALYTLRSTLRALENEDGKERAKHFFKEPINCYGIPAATVKKHATAFFRTISHLPKSDIYAYCEALMQSGYLEEAFIACHCSHCIKKQYEPVDFALFKRWCDTYITNWATCDTFCNHTVGDFLMMYPDFAQELPCWAESSNRWTRRAAAVSLIIPARKGLFLPLIFRIATTLMADTDDLVQKGFGWMLKVASEAHQDEVFDFLMMHKSVMPRTAFRYALEKMPKDLRAKAMQKD